MGGHWTEAGGGGQGRVCRRNSISRGAKSGAGCYVSSLDTFRSPLRHDPAYLWPCLMPLGLGTCSKLHQNLSPTNMKLGHRESSLKPGTARAGQAHQQNKVTEEQRSQSAEGKETERILEENQKWNSQREQLQTYPIPPRGTSNITPSFYLRQFEWVFASCHQ